jgi:uncharacterized membrane-anchored protein
MTDPPPPMPAPAAGAPHAAGWLPPDDALRVALHEEVHARPPARIRLPALIVQVVVLNDGVGRDAEAAHLRRLPGQQALAASALAGNFVHLRLAGHSLRWERHTEFTRYTLTQPLPEGAWPHACDPDLLAASAVDADWLRAIPGRTVAAVALALVEGDPGDAQAVLAAAQRWFGGRTIVASQIGRPSGGGSHSIAATDFRLRADGVVHMLVLTSVQSTRTRVGRVAQRLLDVETYRLMALRGLPAAKALSPQLQQAEATLATLTGQIESGEESDPQLLGRLVALAARLERAAAEHDYRFAATRAYGTLMNDRLTELRETAVPGTQTLGEFLQRRMNPALATVAASAQRLASLAQRVERASALLRTRVDIATELQNQQLLAKLTRGQQMQLRLQTTVEGLSIAAISYYVISLLLYVAKAAQAAGAPLDPELSVGVLIPLVLWGVWRTTRRIHERLLHRAE